MLEHESFKIDLLTEINRLRADPQCYSPFLKEIMINGVSVSESSNEVYFYGGNNTLIPFQGPATEIENYMNNLKKLKPCDTISFSSELSEAAQEKADRIGGKKSFENSCYELTRRIEKYTEWDDSCSESIVCGPTTAKDFLLYLILNPKEETSFANILKENFKHIGIGISLNDETTVIILDFAGSLRPLNTPYYDKNTFKYKYPDNLQFSSKNNSKTEDKGIKSKSVYQLADEDAPDCTKDSVISKTVSLSNGKLYHTVKKMYRIDEDKGHVIQIEEIK